LAVIEEKLWLIHCDLVALRLLATGAAATLPEADGKAETQIQRERRERRKAGSATGTEP
jgi:hypothetical protein